MASGDIILLNGTSSSGKTTIAKAFQQLMPEPYYLFGMDLLQPGFPPGVFQFQQGSSADGQGWQIFFESDRLQKVQPGPGAVRFLTGMYRAIAALASAGNHLVVDDVIYHPDILRAAVTELHHANVLLVMVHLPIAFAEQREQERGDRALGGAQAFYEGVYALDVYDLWVDSSIHSPGDCARQIASAVEHAHPRAAFQELWRRMKSG
jgi:chloramphenicol 3-O phosphotransferase